MSTKMLRQIMVIMPVCMMAIMNGMSYCWVASNMHFLQSTDNEVIPYTNKQCTLLALLLHIGRISGTLINISILGKFGRKSPLIIAGSLYLISSVIILASKVFLVVALSRYLNGLAAGIFECFGSIYQGEILLKSIRGAGSAFVTSCYNFGVLLQYIFSLYLNYDDAAIVSVTYGILLLLSTYCLIESPYFLYSTNSEKALKIISWLHVIDQKQAEKELENISTLDAPSIGAFFKGFNKPEIYKSFCIVLPLGFLQTALTGSFISFANLIIPNTEFMSSHKFAVLLNLIPLIISILSTLCIDRVGRKLLLMIGFSTDIFLTSTVGILFYIQEKSLFTIPHFSWIVFSIIILYLIINALSVSSTTSALRIELFPITHKIVGVASSVMFNSMAFSLTTFFFLQVAKRYGMYLNFLVYGICCIFGLIFVRYFVPETKGKSLTEIQEILKSNKIVS